MAIKGDGTSGKVTSAATINNLQPPFSYHFFAQKSAQPSSGSSSEPFSIADPTGTYLECFAWDDGASPQSFYNRRSSGTYDTIPITGLTLAANTWYGLGVSLSGTSGIGYLNGVQNNTNTWGAPPSTHPNINLLWIGYSPQNQYFSGQLAEVGVWNVALTANEFKALGLGVPPFLIRPQNLLFYAPCRNEAQTIWSPSLISSSSSLALTTAGGVTTTVHPKVYGHTTDDHARRYRTPAALALANGVNFQQAIAQNILGVDGWSNGLNLAGIWTVTQQFLNSVNFHSIFDPGGSIGNVIDFSGLFVSLDKYVAVANEVNFKSKFTGSVGALATGRFREHFYGG
jgi:hypothetical protein